jgi:pimeloyl-ACP methyl ester carboxylesterase
MWPVREREVEVAGVRTWLREAGPDTGAEAVVCVHGNPGSGADWLGLLARVGGFARAVAWDAPGFGQADKPPDFPQTVDGHAGHLGAVLDRLGVTRAHLVLHDFGGLWGLAWAADHPDRVASLVLIDTGVLRGYRGHLLAWIWQAPVLGELLMATTNRFTFGWQLRVGNPRRLPERFVDRMYRDFDRGTRRAVLRLYRSTARRIGLPPRLGSRLSELGRPALVVWGAHDRFLPVRLAGQQREVFRSAEVRVFGGSGHWPFIDDGETVEPVIADFLRRVSQE